MIRHRNPARSLILQWCNNHDETLKRLACHDYPLLRNHSLSLVFHCNRWKSFNCSFGSSTVNGTCVTNEQSAKWNDEQCKLTWNAAISKMLSAHSPFIATKQMNFIEQHQIVCHIVEWSITQVSTTFNNYWRAHQVAPIFILFYINKMRLNKLHIALREVSFVRSSSCVFRWVLFMDAEKTHLLVELTQWIIWQ